MLFFTIDRESDKSYTQQVYEYIRTHILNQQLQEGERIPSTRELSHTLGISRNVVTEAYEQLIAEGYLEVKDRSGTFVAKGSSFLMKELTTTAHVPKNIETQSNVPTIDFRAAHPAMDQFPRKTWSKLAKEVYADADNQVFTYMDAAGVPELKTVLANYLGRVRGVRCIPEQIVITSGATQALYLIMRLLANDQKPFIAVEDPVTDEMRNIFSYSNADLFPVAVDEKGIKTDELPLHRKPNFIFVIPSHQFPLGCTLTIQRRVALIEYARKTDTYIVEDDYDSEFTYEGVPVPSIQGLDPDRVIYVGTFSKILSPALRIGYAILPLSLVESYKTLKWYTDRHTSTLEQLVLSTFIAEGYLDRHVRRMKKIYKKRREALVNSISKHFPNATILGQATGMHLVVAFNNVTFTESIIKKLADKQLLIYSVEQFALQKGSHKNKLILGYGSLDEDQIEKGIILLKRVLDKINEEGISRFK